MRAVRHARRQRDAAHRAGGDVLGVQHYALRPAGGGGVAQRARRALESEYVSAHLHAWMAGIRKHMGIIQHEPDDLTVWSEWVPKAERVQEVAAVAAPAAAVCAALALLAAVDCMYSIMASSLSSRLSNSVSGSTWYRHTPAILGGPWPATSTRAAMDPPSAFP